MWRTLLLLLLGCGRLDFEPHGDTAPLPVSDCWDGWRTADLVVSPPQQVPALATLDARSPSLSSDGLTLYVTRDSNLYSVHRAARDRHAPQQRCDRSVARCPPRSPGSNEPPSRCLSNRQSPGIEEPTFTHKRQYFSTALRTGSSDPRASTAVSFARSCPGSCRR